MTLEQANVEETEKKVATAPAEEDKGKEPEKETKVADAPAGNTKDPEPEPEAEKQAQAEPEQGSGGQAVFLEDLAMKSWVMEQLAAMQAKMDAVLKENEDLKDKNAELTAKGEEMAKKYETDDFGGQQKQGVQKSDKVANETFEEYWKRTH